ncbi:MAG: YihY/virulence factor BrkB family protein [Alphaproteobacteria bacterium]|nr:YihY/virulence factor BrkB family protein [Alphaproteobacteria bacterium]
MGALFAAAALLYAGRRRTAPAAETGPLQMMPAPRVHWGRAFANVWNEQSRDHISVMAAGVAFYGLLSIFPAMSALISIYGLIANPIVIEQQISGLIGVLPHDALKLLSDQLHALIAAPPTKLGLGVIIGLMITMWSATSAAGTLMQALTVAYESEDDRSVLGFYARAFGLTFAMMLFALISLFLIAIVPAILDSLPFPPVWSKLVALLRWPILVVLVFIGLAFLYRFAPARKQPRWHWLGAGTIAAAVLWLAGSAAFSVYVAQFSSYNKTYGSIGAVVVLLMWFYVSAYIILAGAELNAEMDKQLEASTEEAPEARPVATR